jgi:catechol 2,3-dioxygenase-like lactoylglutathione lyase family enzyme
MQALIPSFPVADINRSVEFYQHVLGFELVRITGKDDVTRAFLKAGDVRLVLRSTSGDRVFDYRDRELIDRIMLHIPIRGVTEMYTRIRDRVSIIRELEPRLFGVHEFTLEDLDGILLTFSERIPDTEPAAGASV